MSSATIKTSAPILVEPPTLLTRQPTHDNPGELIPTPDDARHPHRPQLTWRLTTVGMPTPGQKPGHPNR